MDSHLTDKPSEIVALSAKRWFARLAPYRKARDGRAIFESALTIVMFLGCWALICTAVSHGYYWALLGTALSGLLIVRLFIIQHDCGHGSMFSVKKANDWTGRFIGILTLTPYDVWKRGHALHHAGSGNLDRRGMGDDIKTLTVKEYDALSRWRKLQYRLYRHPVVMFGIGPAYIFVFAQRLPWGDMPRGSRSWLSAMATNVGIAAIYLTLMLTVGWKVFLLIQIPTVVVGASIGVWMFYVQHQFEQTHWSRTDDWNRENAALHGSSYYDLPAPLMWLTGNIGVHHVHHLSSRIPFYNLPKILKAHPELKSIGRLTLWQSFKCVKLALWCERTKRMVSFAGRKRSAA